MLQLVERPVTSWMTVATGPGACLLATAFTLASGTHPASYSKDKG